MSYDKKLKNFLGFADKAGMYSDYWYNHRQNDHNVDDPMYWESMLIMTMRALMNASNLSIKERLHYLNEEGKNFIDPRHFLGTIIEFAKNKEIVVPETVNVNWDGNLSAVGDFVKEVIRTYSLTSPHTPDT